RVALRGPGVVGVVLQRRGRGALLPARLLRVPAVARLRGTALHRGQAGLPVPAVWNAGDRYRLAPGIIVVIRARYHRTELPRRRKSPRSGGPGAGQVGHLDLAGPGGPVGHASSRA